MQAVIINAFLTLALCWERREWREAIKEARVKLITVSFNCQNKELYTAQSRQESILQQ